MNSDKAPIAHTCPDIDKVLLEVSNCIKTLKSVIKHCEVDDDAKGDIENVIWDLDSLQGRNSILEKLRSQNEELRSWGNEMYDELQEYKEAMEEEDAPIADEPKQQIHICEAERIEYALNNP